MKRVATAIATTLLAAVLLSACGSSTPAKLHAAPVKANRKITATATGGSKMAAVQKFETDWYNSFTVNYPPAGRLVADWSALSVHWSTLRVGCLTQDLVRFANPNLPADVQSGDADAFASDLSLESAPSALQTNIQHTTNSFSTGNAVTAKGFCAKGPQPKTPGPDVVLSMSGSGNNRTPVFVIPSSGIYADVVSNQGWSLRWSYNCSTLGTSGNFIVELYNSDGSQASYDPAINQLSPAGSGVTNYQAETGSFYFQVLSECSWNLSVVIPPS